MINDYYFGTGINALTTFGYRNFLSLNSTENHGNN